MRYYRITISQSDQTQVGFNNVVYSTLNDDGTNNPMALRVDLDVFQGIFHEPSQNGLVTIYGVPFNDLNQSANFNNANITIEVGMSAGLPLANSQPTPGLIIQGTVLQAYGNWQGTDVRLNLVIIPSTIDPNQPANLSFNWQPGQPLHEAVATTLATAYKLPVLGTYSENLITTEPQPGVFFTMKAFSQYVNNISQSIVNNADNIGACISVDGNGFSLFDSTKPIVKPIQINFSDIIGNLTWLDVSTIQAKVVMRSDINVGSYITFPKGAPTVNNAVQFNQVRNLISFDGLFLVTQVHHVGSSRQANADSWVTVIDAIFNNQTIVIVSGS